MKNDIDEVKNFFDKVAPTWDKKEKEQTFKSLKKIISNIKLCEYKEVLDIGCGTGICFPYLKKIFDNYTGIDISGKMIDIARNKFPTAKFVNADFYRYRFPDNFYNLVIVFNSFPHFEKKRIFLRKIKRILKTGGKIVIAHGMRLEEINKIHKKSQNKRIQMHTITSKEMFEFLKKEGFKNIKMIENEYFYIEGTKV